MKRTKDIADIATPRSAAHLVSPHERAAAGKVLHDKIPRKQHGEWNAVQGRPNPIDLLHKSDAGRLKRLVPIRYGRMLQSPFADLSSRNDPCPEAEATLDQIFHAYRESLADNRRILLDRYRVVDVAIKVVGVGSVGRRCWIALMMSEGNDPLFLQFKEAVHSVLEPYCRASPWASCWRC